MCYISTRELEMQIAQISKSETVLRSLLKVDGEKIVSAKLFQCQEI